MAGPTQTTSKKPRAFPSANDIAQANATAHYFARHPQNRWMTDLNGSEAGLGRRSMEESNITVPAGVSRGSGAPSGSGAKPMQSAPPGATVENEAPDTTRPATLKDSMDRNTAMRHPVGLPSPPPSEGNVNSPSHAAVNMHAHNAPGTVPMPARRQSAPKRTISVPSNGQHQATSPVASFSHNRRPSAQHSVPPLASPHASGGYTYAEASSRHAVPPVLPQHHQQHQHHQSQPLLPQELEVQDSHDVALYCTFLRHKLSEFEQTKLRPHPTPAAQGPDAHRLSLLRTAIDRQDWCFIVLNQLQALRHSGAEFLPDLAKRLDPRAFAWLDIVLHPFSELSPALVQFMASSSTIATTIGSLTRLRWHQQQVLSVVTFLQYGLQHWNSFIFETRKNMAPPLVEDMVDALRCESPILREIIFRFALENLRTMSSDFMALGLPKFVALHCMDHNAFVQGRRRSAAQRQKAYETFRAAFVHWEDHVRHAVALSWRHQHLPPEQRPLPPQFVVPNHLVVEFCYPGVAIPAELFASIPAQSAAIPTQRHQAQSVPQRAPHPMPQRVPAPAPAPVETPRPQHSGNPSGPQSAFLPVDPVLQVPSHCAPPSGLPANANTHPPGYFFPSENSESVAQPREPETARCALHQAHLRSPVLVPRDPDAQQPQLYRHVAGYPLTPKRINKDAGIDTIAFSIPPAQFNRIMISGPAQRTGGPPTRTITEGSLTFRLRCCAVRPGSFPGEDTWVTADTVWPIDLFLELNGTMLEPRRKLHYGRYLPIDLTDFIRQGGNELTTIVLPDATDQQRPKNYAYAIAVEGVGVISHKAIKETIAHISVEDSRGAIVQALSTTNNNHDDEVAVTSNNMTVKLFDPISSSKIFDIPVRGRACAHKDCFDLETFLAVCKRDPSGLATVVDCWRCPICRGDVRPQTLVVDDFLAQVRETLAQRNLLDTRAIVIEADGSWTPKEERRQGVRSASMECEEPQADAAAASLTGGMKKVEVIEID